MPSALPGPIHRYLFSPKRDHFHQNVCTFIEMEDEECFVCKEVCG